MNGNLGEKSNVTNRHETNVFEKTIKKSDAIAYLSDRNESEIIYRKEDWPVNIFCTQVRETGRFVFFWCDLRVGFFGYLMPLTYS